MRRSPGMVLKFATVFISFRGGAVALLVGTSEDGWALAPALFRRGLGLYALLEDPWAPPCPAWGATFPGEAKLCGNFCLRWAEIGEVLMLVLALPGVALAALFWLMVYGLELGPSSPGGCRELFCWDDVRVIPILDSLGLRAWLRAFFGCCGVSPMLRLPLLLFPTTFRLRPYCAISSLCTNSVFYHAL